MLITSTALNARVRIDDSLFMYFEEVDLGFSLGRSGAQVLIDGRVKVKNHGSPNHYSPYIGYWMQRNRLYILAKYADWYHICFYLLYSFMFELPMRCIVRSVQGHGSFAAACIKGQMSACREIFFGRVPPPSLSATSGVSASPIPADIGQGWRR